MCAGTNTQVKSNICLKGPIRWPLPWKASHPRVGLNLQALKSNLPRLPGLLVSSIMAHASKSNKTLVLLEFQFVDLHRKV